jgi:hypothetical protein
MRNGLDLRHKDTQIGLPAMKPEERVVVAAEVLRQCRCAGDHLIEHAAEGRTIDDAGLHGEADDTASELIMTTISQ